MDNYSNLKDLLQKDWRWVVVVSLLLALPTYGLMPISYAVVAHLVITLIYVGLLFMFGPGFVIVGAMFVLLWAIVVGLIGPTIHLWNRHHTSTPPTQSQEEQAVPIK